MSEFNIEATIERLAAATYSSGWPHAWERLVADCARPTAQVERSAAACHRRRVRETIDGLTVEELLFLAGRRDPAPCPMCHGTKTVNFEQANGWDEPCPNCSPERLSRSVGGEQPSTTDSNRAPGTN